MIAEPSHVEVLESLAAEDWRALDKRFQKHPEDPQVVSKITTHLLQDGDYSRAFSYFRRFSEARGEGISAALRHFVTALEGQGNLNGAKDIIMTYLEEASPQLLFQIWQLAIPSSPELVAACRKRLTDINAFEVLQHEAAIVRSLLWDAINDKDHVRVGELSTILRANGSFLSHPVSVGSLPGSSTQVDDLEVATEASDEEVILRLLAQGREEFSSGALDEARESFLLSMHLFNLFKIGDEQLRQEVRAAIDLITGK